MIKTDKKDLLLHFSICVSKENLSYVNQIMKTGIILKEEGVEGDDVEIGEVVEIRGRFEGDDLNNFIALMILFNQHLVDDKPYITLEDSTE